ncbi:MAG: sigma-70 family RNA polymerase sigma factor [Bacteroidota bacterium]
MKQNQSNQYYLNGIRRNDSTVVRAIYNNYFGSISNWVSNHRGDTSDAQDIFQEALMSIFRRLKKGNLEIEYAFNTYLFAVCKRIWFKRLKKPDFAVTSPDEAPLNDTETELITEAIERNEKYELFYTKLKQLGADCQQVLQLHFAKKSFKEIAAALQYASEEYARRKKYLCKNELTKLIRADVRYGELAF